MLISVFSLASAAASDETCNATTPAQLAAEDDDDYGLATGPCNFVESPAVSPEVLLSLALSTAEPIIVRGLLDEWSAVGDEGVSGLLDEWETLKVDASLGARMGTEGPPTKAGVWPVKSVRQQLRQAAAKPVDELAFYDRIVFQNVSGTPQLESLLATAPPAFSHLVRRPSWATTRLSMAGARGGIAWHYHEASVNFQLSGAKRWFAFHNDDPELDHDLMYYLREYKRPYTMLEWLERIYPRDSLQARWRRRAWECTQRAGDVVIVPGQINHAVLAARHGTVALVVERSSDDGAVGADVRRTRDDAHAPTRPLETMQYAPPDATKAGDLLEPV